MIIEEFHIYTFQLPILKPLQIGTTPVTSRSGVIIYIKMNESIYGFGEASPLPGLHQESLNNVKSELVEIKSLLMGTHREEVFTVIDNLQNKKKLSSSVQFAIESAILNMDEQAKLSGRKKILPEPEHNKIYVNVLATGDESTILRKIEKSISDNFKSIKIKVGRNSADAEIKLISTIRELIGDKITLRLDANQAWELEEAVIFVNSVKNMEIEYVEEPLNNPRNLPDLFERTGLRIALDESLIDMPPESIIPAKWINTLILKPSLIGSVRKTLRYINRAKELGLKVVISDTFHSGIGLSFLIRLASTIIEPTPMGFDTYSWIGDDLLVEKLPVQDGCFDLNAVMNICSKIDLTKLEKVG